MVHNRLLELLLSIALMAPLAGALAGPSCSATNDNNDATCNVECLPGQSAACSDASGSSTPSCECKGTPLPSFLRTKAEPSLLLNLSAQSIEQTNLLLNINTKLATLRDYVLTENCHQEETHRHCERPTCVVSVPSAPAELTPLFGLCPGPEICLPVYGTVCVPVKGKLAAVEPILPVSPAKVTVVAPSWTDVPSSILGFKDTYKNCSSLKQSTTYSYSETTRLGSKVSKTKTLSTTSKIDAKVEFSFFDTTKGELGVGFSQTVGMNSNAEESHEYSYVLSHSMPIDVAPMTNLVTHRYWIKRIVPVQFTGEVTVDSAVTPNKEGVIGMSQLLPAQEDRTFSFAGVVSSAVLSEAVARNLETKLTQEDCLSSAGTFSATRELLSQLP